METIRKAGKPTANMVTVTTMQAPIGKSANVLAFKHVIARYATKGGTKRAMNVSARKGGKSQITADVGTTSVFTGKSGTSKKVGDHIGPV